MQEPTEQTSWLVVIILILAALVATTIGNTILGIILITILVGVCGVLAMRYERGGKSS